MPEITIYHNPKCGTSRKVLEAIRQAGEEPRIVEYLKTPPTVAELKTLLECMGKTPSEILRKKESLYKDLKLDQELPSDAQLLKLLHEHPVLMERPIVAKGRKAILARPPERLKDIL